MEMEVAASRIGSFPGVTHLARTRVLSGQLQDQTCADIWLHPKNKAVNSRLDSEAVGLTRSKCATKPHTGS